MPVAAIDIGSNTVRLLIADVTEGGGLQERVRRVDITALGQGLDQTGMLSPRGVRTALRILQDYRADIDRHGVEAVRVVATAASREAANGGEFLTKVSSVLDGTVPDLITGEAEARLAYRGASGSFPALDDPLVIDIGGGSTELVTADHELSLPIGSVRLTDRRLPDKPALAHQIATARSEVREMLDAAELPSGFGSVIGVAGTWTSLSAIVQDLPVYNRALVHGSNVSRAQLDRVVHDLAAQSLESLQLIGCLDPARAPVILGGAVIALTVLAVLGAESIVVSEHDLLDGVALGIAWP